MMGLGKPQLHTKIEVGSFSRCKNIKGELQNFSEAPLAQGYTHFSSAWDFMMGLGKPQRLVKFEVAGFIYYGNIRKLVFKIWNKPKWENPLLFGETDFTVGFPDPMFPLRCATVVELRLQQMGDFYEKPHFTMENFKFRGL